MKGVKRLLIFAAIVIAGIWLVGFFLAQQQSTAPFSPTTHTPTFLGSYPFILGSGNVLQNGIAYSYVWINASAIKRGDSFTVFPALNVELQGKGINQNNFTAEVIYLGSVYESSPYWLNFSVVIKSLNFSTNPSQAGIGGTYRSSASLPGLSGVEFFSQISNVVGESGEFEYFFYIGNPNTPIPTLTHGNVR
jgi:hypothetical protein